MDSKAVKLIDMILKCEGYYVCDPLDNGGETYRGISRAANPKWDGWKIVDANKPLKKNQKINDPKLEDNVRQFYYKYYYSPAKIDKLDDLLSSGHTFSMAVNAGVRNGAKLLQKAINKVYNVKIAVDGVIGQETLKYANGGKSREVGIEMINQCNEYYEAIVRKKPSQKKFLNGWKNRVNDVTKTCTENTVNVLYTISDKKGSWLEKLLFFIFSLLKK